MQRREAFSLLELSVVIALIGLVAGVVFVGQSFATRYKLRTILVDASNYAVALQQFQITYSQLPGDMVDATRYWGNANDGGAVQCTNPVTDSNANHKWTCNGDGDGFISATNCEQYRVWQHLAAAGLVTGSYTGVSGAGACAANSQPGVNVPVGTVKNSGYSLTSFGFDAATHNAVISGNATFFDGDYRNAMVFGTAVANNFTNGPALGTDVAKELDLKADDALPATGSIRTFKAPPATPACANAAGTAYNEMNPNLACALLFMNSYQNYTKQ